MPGAPEHQDGEESWPGQVSKYAGRTQIAVMRSEEVIDMSETRGGSETSHSKRAVIGSGGGGGEFSGQLWGDPNLKIGQNTSVPVLNS